MEITIEQQKEIATNILKKIQLVYPEAIIAGGAPRNWNFEKLANDIDIWVFETNEKLLQYRLENMGFLHPQIKEKIDYGTGSDEGKQPFFSLSIVEFKANNFWSSNPEVLVPYQKIQVMGISADDFVVDLFSPLSPSVFDCLTQMFDFGICKICFDGVKTGYDYTFLMDKQDKTLTVNVAQMVKVNRYWTLPYRANKLQSYFPDHKIKLV